MKELNKREKIIVGIVAVVLVGFLVNRFVLEPQNKKMKQLRKELASLNEQAEEKAGSRTGTGFAPKGRDC
ncbi:MAG: DUF4149 domain-containing protein [Deltaproteobacteria bacterium]|nr:DUF4149 domain-containing protein [Deltaproteobacteria bacterium]